MNLRKETLDALEAMHITTLTAIQENVIPHACNHEDIFAISPTGSGKTFAYLLPILEQIEVQGKGKHFPRALILVPTRELALQITQVIRTLLEKREGIRTALLTGGVDIQKQIRSFHQGADVIVGTPSRVKDHLRRHTCKPKFCDMLVIDEVDEMLQMGFIQDIQDIKQALPPHQTMLFSASYTAETESFASGLLHDPFVCKIKQEQYLKQNIETKIIHVEEKKKIDALEKIIQKTKGQILVFANTRKTCDFINTLLQKKNYSIKTIHSEMDYAERKKIMESFRNHDLKILCSTDVAARGIDIPSVETVILYDLPETQAQYMHRIGRTARAFHHGIAYVFLTHSQQLY